MKNPLYCTNKFIVGTGIIQLSEDDAVSCNCNWRKEEGLDIKKKIIVFKSDLHYEVALWVLVIHALLLSVLEQEKTSFLPKKK